MKDLDWHWIVWCTHVQIFLRGIFFSEQCSSKSSEAEEFNTHECSGAELIAQMFILLVHRILQVRLMLDNMWNKNLDASKSFSCDASSDPVRSYDCSSSPCMYGDYSSSGNKIAHEVV